MYPSSSHKLPILPHSQLQTNTSNILPHLIFAMPCFLSCPIYYSTHLLLTKNSIQMRVPLLQRNDSPRHATISNERRHARETLLRHGWVTQHVVAISSWVLVAPYRTWQQRLMLRFLSDTAKTIPRRSPLPFEAALSWPSPNRPLINDPMSLHSLRAQTVTSRATVDSRACVHGEQSSVAIWWFDFRIYICIYNIIL